MVDGRFSAICGEEGKRRTVLQENARVYHPSPEKKVLEVPKDHPTVKKESGMQDTVLQVSEWCQKQVKMLPRVAGRGLLPYNQPRVCLDGVNTRL